MIDTFGVKGFKSLVDVRLELGQLNVFIGANGSGKSNVLEAVGLLGCAVSGKVGMDSFATRGVRPGQPTLFKSAFKSEKIPRLIRLDSVSRGGTSYRVGLDNPIEKPNPNWGFTSETLETPNATLGSRSPAGLQLEIDGRLHSQGKAAQDQGICPLVRTLHDQPALLADLSDIENFAIYTPFTPMLRGSIQDPSERPILGLSGGRLADALVDLARSDKDAFDLVGERLDELAGWTASFQVLRTRSVEHTASVVRFRDRFLRAGRDVLLAGDVSEGALYVLFLLILTHHRGIPRVFAIDNVDAALNPLLAKAVIARLQEAILATDDRQVLLTAHNPLVLDALALQDDRVRLFLVERNSQGHTEVRRLPYTEALAKAQAKGMTLSRLWVSGALGAVPEL